MIEKLQNFLLFIAYHQPVGGMKARNAAFSSGAGAKVSTRHRPSSPTVGCNPAFIAPAIEFTDPTAFGRRIDVIAFLKRRRHATCAKNINRADCADVFIIKSSATVRCARADYGLVIVRQRRCAETGRCSQWWRDVRCLPVLMLVVVSSVRRVQ